MTAREQLRDAIAAERAVIDAMLRERLAVGESRKLTAASAAILAHETACAVIDAWLEARTAAAGSPSWYELQETKAQIFQRARELVDSLRKGQQA